MPIGFAREGGGSLRRPEAQDQAPTWAEKVRAQAQTVIVNATGVDSSNRTLVPTLWSRWATAYDERVCPVCSPFAGRIWPLGEGPQPPLHPGCRCERRYAFTTWSLRELM